MANYTEHYQLHQWEPGDSFLRTDFNGDFSTLDRTLWGKTDASQILCQRTTEKSSDVQRFDLSGIDWDRWDTLTIYVNAKRVSSSAGFAFDLDGASWSTPPSLCVATPAVPAMAVLFPRRDGGQAITAVTFPGGVLQTASMTYREIGQLSVYGISMDLPVGTSIVVRGN